jgi:hypothetical protein
MNVYFDAIVVMVNIHLYANFIQSRSRLRDASSLVDCDRNS